MGKREILEAFLMKRIVLQAQASPKHITQREREENPQNEHGTQWHPINTTGGQKEKPDLRMRERRL